MKVPKDVQFPEYTNPGINAAITADKVNEILAFLRDKYPEENAFKQISVLKPGVTFNGTNQYRLNGKLIKKEEAFL